MFHWKTGRNGYLAMLTGVFMFAALVTTSSAPYAQTPDGVTPSGEWICEGLPSSEFGLCNAYCEALDCDARERPSKACESLRDNYFEQTGFTAFPCDETCPELPDPSCSGNGVIGTDGDSCEVCLCFEDWSGPDCATCDVGVDSCGVCGGYDDCVR